MISPPFFIFFLMEPAFIRQLYEDHKVATRCPSPALVSDFFNKLLAFLFPEISTNTYASFNDFQKHHGSLQDDFRYILSKRLNRNADEDASILQHVFESLPEIRTMLKEDIQAMYDGDPAAKSLTEVVRTYPGFYAIASYRIAHCMCQKGLSLIARIITSNAHSKTGIDIHPSAIIGRHFCIDHGTGLVIGETTRIGNHVKLYQGVTLGALSVRKQDAKTKRHPDIEDHVVIYSGATILGGKTVIGHHSTIGGNVWLTNSVEPHSKINYQPPVSS